MSEQAEAALMSIGVFLLGLAAMIYVLIKVVKPILP